MEAPATEAIDWASPRPGSSGERKLVSSQGESLSVEGAEHESIAHPSPEKKEGDVTAWGETHSLQTTIHTRVTRQLASKQV